MNNPMLIGAGIFGVVLLVFLWVLSGIINAWVKSIFNQAPVGLANLVAFKFARIPCNVVVDARIKARRAGIELNANQIAAHHVAGGDVGQTVQALIVAREGGIELGWERACALDLMAKGSGKSVVEIVRTSVAPGAVDRPQSNDARVRAT